MSSPPPAAAVLRPWPEFFSLSAVSVPISLSESTYRLTQNLRFFLPNYVVLALLVFLATLLTRPLALILFIAVSAAWAHLLLHRGEPITVFAYHVDRRVVAGFLAALTVAALFWTGVWMKLVVAVVVGGLVVLVHGVLRAPEESMEDSPYGSLLNVVDDDSSRGEYASV